jgi:hypothetical protein
VHLLCVIRVIECRGFMCIDMVSVHFLGVCAVWGDLGGNWVSLCNVLATSGRPDTSGPDVPQADRTYRGV